MVVGTRHPVAPGTLPSIATPKLHGEGMSPEVVRGISLYQRGLYRDALASFETVLKHTVDLPEMWCNKGAALFQLGKYKEAHKAFDRAIEYDACLPEAWNNRGTVLSKLGDYQAALESIERALVLRQDYPNARLNEGLIFVVLGKPQEAQVAFEKAVELNPADAKAWYNLAGTLWSLGNAQEAQLAFEKAYELNASLSDGGAALYKAWAMITVAQGLVALVSNDIRAFEEAGLKCIDILEKAQEDGMGQAVEEALAQFKANLKKKKDLKAFEELEIFINLMKIKDPSERWWAIGKVVSARWPMGHSAVKAVREMRR